MWISFWKKTKQNIDQEQVMGAKFANACLSMACEVNFVSNKFFGPSSECKCLPESIWISFWKQMILEFGPC